MGKDQVVVLTNRVWQQRFGATATSSAGEVRIDAKPHTVVGILAPGPADRVLNRPLLAARLHPGAEQPRLSLAARDGPAEAGGLAAPGQREHGSGGRRSIAEENPATNKGWSASVEPLQNNFLSKRDHHWPVVAAGGGRVRAADRLRERGEPAAGPRDGPAAGGCGTRLAGARRGAQIFAQFLTESLLLAAIGGAAGRGPAPGPCCASSWPPCRPTRCPRRPTCA